MRKHFLTTVAISVVLALSLPAAYAQNTDVYIEQGGAKLVVASGGEIEVQSGGVLDVQSGATFTCASAQTYTLAADEFFKLDGATTAQTQTAGLFDVNFASITADTSAFNISAVTNNGAPAATDVFGGIITITQNDADADAFGLKIILDATANATTASYEYGILVDCEENTAASCNDGILITASGANTGMTDGLDVSATNITNAINIGDNPIVTGNVAGTIGDSTTDSWTFTTDGTGDAEIALPENSIGPDEVAVMVEEVILCGDIDSGASTYWGPNTTVFGGDASASSAISSSACQALDNTTEGTADAAILANTAFKVLGMRCSVTGSGSNGVTMTARSAAADLTPSVTCTIATGETTCASVTGSTTDVAAGATIAIHYADTEDLNAQDGWCKLFVAYK
jgi:hypothetical protein